MKYKDLYKYLRENENLNRAQSIRTIVKIRKFPKEIKKAVNSFLNTGTCELTIADVSFRELTRVEGMKPMRAFKMLDWLMREPKLAYRYLSRRITLADMSQHGSAKVAENIEETDKSDIEL